MLPAAEAGRPDALDQAVSPSNEAGPSKPPAAAKQLQGQPGAPGRGAAAEAGMNNARTTPTRTPVGSASSSSLKAAGLLDPNRAFQAINAETLEVASAQADYPIPPVTTQVPMLLKLWQLLLLTTTVAGLQASDIFYCTASSWSHCCNICSLTALRRVLHFPASSCNNVYSVAPTGCLPCMQLTMSEAMSWLCLQDAINMQINNLARDNLHDKLDILSSLVTDEFWPWFANYMVVKRAAQVRPLQLLVNAHLPSHETYNGLL